MTRLMRSAFKRRFACGSIVLFHFICFSFFRSASEKTKNKKKIKYRCERPYPGYRISRVKDSLNYSTLHLPRVARPPSPYAILDAFVSSLHAPASRPRLNMLPLKIEEWSYVAPHDR